MEKTHPRDLVCARCWRDLFDTEAFERCCNYDRYTRPTGGGGDPVEATATGTIGETRAAALSGCGWCAHLMTFFNDEWEQEDTVKTLIYPAMIKTCTPEGANLFYLEVTADSPEGRHSSWGLFLHAFTCEDDPASPYVTARPVQTHVSSDSAVQQLQCWLGGCREHETCSDPHRERALPTRIIDVSPAGCQQPRLRESGGAWGAYATLSYCWGGTPFQTLNGSNYEQFLEGLNMDELPATIRDAIITTRNLGLQYIWIDSLCILQDSEEDTEKEIMRMKDIYADSAVTIVAAAASDVNQGFLQQRKHSETVYSIPFKVSEGVFGSMSINELDAACYDELLEPLATRAWTMQEQLLAARTLTYATHTIIWSCQAGYKTLDNCLHFPFDLGSGYNDDDEKYSLNVRSLLVTESYTDQNKDRALSCWLRLVTAYSLRRASMESDKLTAVSGIASHRFFSAALGPQYFAGMWEYNLARQLLWYTSSRHRILPEGETFKFYRPTRYRAPSWSWASLEGGIVHTDFSFDDEYETPPEVVCDVVHCSTIPKYPDTNRFGEVTSAQLTVRGPLKKAWFDPATRNVLFDTALASGDHACLQEEPGAFQEAWERHLADFMVRNPDVDLEDDPSAADGCWYGNILGTRDESGPDDPLIVTCLAITIDTEAHYVHGLMLVPDGGENGDTTYKRLGVFQQARDEIFQGVAKVDIDLI